MMSWSFGCDLSQSAEEVYRSQAPELILTLVVAVGRRGRLLTVNIEIIHPAIRHTMHAGPL